MPLQTEAIESYCCDTVRLPTIRTFPAKQRDLIRPSPQLQGRAFNTIEQSKPLAVLQEQVSYCRIQPRPFREAVWQKRFLKNGLGVRYLTQSHANLITDVNMTTFFLWAKLWVDQ